MGRPDNIKKLSLILNEINTKTIEQSIFNFAKEYADLNETPFLFDSIYSDKFNEIYKIGNNNNDIVITTYIVQYNILVLFAGDIALKFKN